MYGQHSEFKDKWYTLPCAIILFIVMLFTIFAVFDCLISKVFGQEKTTKKSKVAEISAYMSIVDGDTIFNMLKPTEIKSGVFEQKTFNNKTSKNSASYSIETGGDYIRFYYRGGNVNANKFISKNDGVSEWNYGKETLKLRHLENGVKEEIIIQEGGSLKHSWLIASNLSRHKEGFGKYKIYTPFTIDAKKDTLKTITSVAWKDTAWWMDIEVDAGKATYPITIDPSVIDTSSVGSSNRNIYSRNADYATARNASIGTIYNYNRIGQDNMHSIYRSFFNFTYPTVAGIDSAILELKGSAEATTGTDGIIVVSSLHTVPTVNNTDFDLFVGHTASGAYTTIKPLNKSYNMSSWKYDGTWNKIYFNAGGIDTIESKTNLKIVLISQDDSSSSASAGNDFISASNTYTDVRLVIYYSIIPNVYAADSLHCNSLTDSSAKLLQIKLPSVADTTNNNKYSIKYKSNGYWLQPADSSDNPFNKNEQKYVYSVLKNITLPLVNNFNHIFEIRSWNETGTDSLKTKLDTLTLGNPSAGSDTVTIGGTPTKGIIPDVSNTGIIIDVQN